MQGIGQKGHGSRDHPTYHLSNGDDHIQQNGDSDILAGNMMMRMIVMML